MATIGGIVVEIGFSGADGYIQLEQAIDELEEMKQDLPWLAERIDTTLERLVFAAAGITCVNNQSGQSTTHGNDSET